MRYENKPQEELFSELKQLRKGMAELKKEKLKRQKAEKALERIREDLEVRIQKRTLEISRVNVDLKEEISRYKQAQGEIEELERQIEFILGATKTGLDIIDSDFNICFIDPQWAKVYGDPNGRKCYEYFMDGFKPCPKCGVKKALETKTTVITEESLIKENNRPIQVITIPFQNKDGEWMVAEVNIDIAERKQIEAQLRKKINELEKTIAELKKNRV
ncbi:MAG: hypothetical protein ABIH27_05685 [Candidatus Omnitrophota bacterium]